jgi:hypothetical protein
LRPRIEQTNKEREGLPIGEVFLNVVDVTDSKHISVSVPRCAEGGRKIGGPGANTRTKAQVDMHPGA